MLLTLQDMNEREKNYFLFSFVFPLQYYLLEEIEKFSTEKKR